jgi:cell division transport system permease protein
MSNGVYTPMLLRIIYYIFQEVFRSLKRNSLLNFAAVGTTAISLFVLGVGMLLMINVHHIANTVESNVEIMVYLKDDISEDEASSMEPIFYRVSGVEEVFFIPPDEGLELLEGWMGEGSDLGSLSEENFLPNAYKVKTGDPHEVGDAAAEIERVPGVEKVRYEQGVVEKLFALTNWVRIIGLIVIVLLAASAIFLIATTTRLTFFARSREINIMKYVGATDWFVRWPFLLEGVILGCIGALLTVGILYLSYGMLTVKLQQTITFLPLVTDSNDMLTIYGVLLGLGVLLGAIGSSISMRKYLRV